MPLRQRVLLRLEPLRVQVQKRLVREWEGLEFNELQASLRELVDRAEVDGTDLKLFLRL